MCRVRIWDENFMVEISRLWYLSVLFLVNNTFCVYAWYDISVVWLDCNT